MRNYKNLIESTRARLNPDGVTFQRSFNEELSTISYSDALMFVRLAMKSVEPSYTQRTRDAGDRAKEHLNNGFTDKVFRYQGSVMTNTHIKGYSDIDLLVISDKFYSWDASRVRAVLNEQTQRSNYSESSVRKLLSESEKSSYQGNSISDLQVLRNNSETILYGIYDICDISKPKSIKITNKSLNREVDIVIANWYDDVSSIINDKGDYRGIQIFNKDKQNVENPDYPFTSIKRINERSSFTAGRLKKMIRFMKTVKAESETDIDLSSFDINAICYDIDTATYKHLSFVELVGILYKQLRSICINDAHADKIVSVDGREYIFRFDQNKKYNVRKVLQEIEGIYQDLQGKLIYG